MVVTTGSRLVLDSTNEIYVVGSHKFAVDEISGNLVHLVEMNGQWYAAWMVLEMLKDRMLAPVIKEGDSSTRTVARLPRPDPNGNYVYEDGCSITKSVRPGKWIARWANRAYLTSDNDETYYFNSAEDAAAALAQWLP